jgi:hypothetical protein
MACRALTDEQKKIFDARLVARLKMLVPRLPLQAFAGHNVLHAAV